ncbi:MAG: MotA/TolQ/ExbB proton channel family protein [Firmicutes bacterium]|nr:MotA/TolQ/ExbB proton channel family protein [Bacillota bacterium]MBO2520376.1 MotA/TolQ/ExbB proton channel family protein [Bacillota bacterium]
MLEIIIRGGPVMYPLLLCSVIALAITLERIWYLMRTRTDAEELMEDVKLCLQEGKLLEAMQLLKRTKGPVAAILSEGIAYSDRSKDEIRERLEEVGNEEIFKMERGLGVLSAIVTISPMLGLLGTVTGIIRSFRVLGSTGIETNPAALAAGIAEALITTAVGLVIAIPSLAVYHWLTSMIERRVREMSRRALELTDLIAGGGAPS